jgi:hypothetical protein
VGLHVDNVIPPTASYNAWCIGVDDLGIVADIIPHLEEVSSFIVTSTVKAACVDATLNGYGILLDGKYQLSKLGSSNVYSSC